MDRAEALAVLGLGPEADPVAVRAAFRRLVRDAHPDRDPLAADSAGVTTRLIEARAVLLGPAAAAGEGADGSPRPSTGRRPPGPPRGSTQGARSAGPVDGRVTGDSVLVDADPATVMAVLVDAGHRLGEVTYLDRSSGYVEVLLQVQEEGDPAPAAVSLVASLQGRVEGIEVFCTVERLDGHPAPPVAPIVAALAAEMGLPPT